MTSTIRNLNR